MDVLMKIKKQNIQGMSSEVVLEAEIMRVAEKRMGMFCPVVTVQVEQQ